MLIDKKTLRKVFVLIAGGIAFGWLLLDTARATTLFNRVWDLFSPFVAGAAIAFIFNVPMRAIESKLKFIKSEKPQRIAAILLTLLAIALVIAGVVMLLIPQIRDTLELLMSQLPDFFARTQAKVMAFLEAHPEPTEAPAAPQA